QAASPEAETVTSEPPRAERRWQVDWRPTLRRPSLRRPTLPEAGPWIVMLAITILYSAISIGRDHRYRTESWDVGIFTEAVKQYAHFHAPIVDIKGAGYNLLGDHFHPILAVLGPIFLVFPTPVTLLIAQAALFGLAVVPVIRLGVRRLGTFS